MTATWPTISESDIVGRWRPLDGDEKATIAAVIEDTHDLLQTRLEEIGITKPVASERWARMYVSAAAWAIIRMLKNPEGYLEETIDGYRYRRDKAVSSGALYVSDEDRANLRPVERRRKRGAFSVRLGQS